jgi:hypothetical protein
MDELKNSHNKFPFIKNGLIFAFLISLLPFILGSLINTVGWKSASILGVDVSYGVNNGSFNYIGISNQDNLLTYISGACLTTLLIVMLFMPVLLGSLVVRTSSSSIRNNNEVRNAGIFSGAALAFFLVTLFFIITMYEMVYSDVVYRNTGIIQSMQEQIHIFLMDPTLLLIIPIYLLIGLVVIVPMTVLGANICRKGLIKSKGYENVQQTALSRIIMVFIAALILVGGLSVIVAFLNHVYLYLTLTYFLPLLLFIPLSWAGVYAPNKIKITIVMLLIALSLIVLKIMPPIQLV